MIIKSFELQKIKSSKSSIILIYGNNEGLKEQIIKDCFLNNSKGDILNYDDSDVTDLNTNERLKILRGQFESHDNVFLPGPYNTRVTDEEGLDAAISDLDEDNEKAIIENTKHYQENWKRYSKSIF